MLKIIKNSFLFSFLTIASLALTTQAASAEATCSVNGVEVSCDQLGEQVGSALGIGIIGFIIFFAIGIWAMVFWILMIVHAAKNDIENKAMWIILMVFTGLIGAIIYYFVVKKPMNGQTVPPVAPVVPTPPPTQMPK